MRFIIFLTLYLQVLMESIERVLEFVKRSKAVSPTVALETATALQVKWEGEESGWKRHEKIRVKWRCS